jgi:hypothetical protein
MQFCCRFDQDINWDSVVITKKIHCIQTWGEQGEIGFEYWTGYNDDIATSKYLYQIMVRREGTIPLFTDMGKMILLK